MSDDKLDDDRGLDSKSDPVLFWRTRRWGNWPRWRRLADELERERGRDPTREPPPPPARVRWRGRG